MPGSISTGSIEMVPFNKQEETNFMYPDEDPPTWTDKCILAFVFICMLITQIIYWLVTTPQIIYKKVRKHFK